MSQKLTITMISNGMSHHQIPFCEYMAGNEEVDFHFIATKPLSEERANMGYQDLNFSGDYIVRSYESEESFRKAMQLADESDFVIYGSAPYSYIKNRLRQKKWTFIYSERIFKKGICDRATLKTVIAYFCRYFCVSHKRLRLLCASAYASPDFRYFRFKQKHTYKWGYFPPDTKKNKDDLFKGKKENSIVWVARMIPLKHPEMAVDLAERLRNNGTPFHLTMVGDGVLFNDIESMIQEKELSQFITMTRSLPTEETRNVMENSEILITTSDYREGWGAIVNEGMNSACVVVGSHIMGAVPFLILGGYNGFIFESQNSEELYEKVCYLIQHPEQKKKMSMQAFQTIKEEWNGENAGRKFVEMCKQFQAGNEDFCYLDGVCSIAK